MRRLIALCAIATVAGCATTPVEVPPPVDYEAACSKAASLSRRGEHKPAVDNYLAVRKNGGSCSETVVETVRQSERRLSKADEFARAGLDARDRGDIATARESFRLALAAYPQYYWVQKLAADLEGGSLATAERTEELLAESRNAQQAGNLVLAARKLQDAVEARPPRNVFDEIVDLGRRLGLALFSSGELKRARDLWQAVLSLDPENELIRRYLDEVEESLRNLDAIKDDG